MQRFSYLLCAVLLTGFLLSFSSPGGSEEKVIPAQYKREGYFAGGKPLEGAVLSGIRFGKHSDFLRAVFDLSQVQDGKITGAPWHPVYKIEYRKYPYRFRIEFQGVKYLETSKIGTEHALPLTIVTTPDNTIKIIEIFINKPALFKVIEVDDPAKLALDIKTVNDEVIPKVFAVQLKDVDDVETAFKLLDGNALPEGVNADVLVVGNAVFVEAVFLSLEEAAETAALLEKNGFTTLISERMGNELPRL